MPIEGMNDVTRNLDATKKGDERGQILSDNAAYLEKRNRRDQAMAAAAEGLEILPHTGCDTARVDLDFDVLGRATANLARTPGRSPPPITRADSQGCLCA